MNERIKQIAFEAGQGGHSWYNDPNCIQAFAELIVRECVSICKDIDDEDHIDAWPDRQDCAAEILEHFGVEE